MADTMTKDVLMIGAVGVGAYFLYEYFKNSCTANPSGLLCSFFTPGTTSSTSGGQTSVSQTPTSTVTLPTAAQLQTAGNATTSSADGWNYIFSQQMGFGIDRIYGFSFDDVYGIVGSAQRSTAITAQAFLQAPILFGKTPQTLHGLGAFVRYPGPIPLTRANMLFSAHHPTPYGLTYTLRGLGAFTHATGFERAMAGRPLRQTRIFGRQTLR
jgi:hypothetical protein